MDVRHLSFRLLQVYVRVVQLGNVSAAARQLHLTQPTVSLQLKKLAETVGEPLLESRDQRLQVTMVGEALYQAATDVLSRFDDFNEQLGAMRGGQRGHLSVAVVNTAQYIMPLILGAFYRQFPRIEVTLNIGNRAHILQRFEHQQDDLYLFSHPPSGDKVVAHPIIKNPLQVIAPEGHFAAAGQTVDFNDLKHERFLLREPGSATRMQFEAWLSSRGIELTHTMQIESNEAIRLSVASGLGLSVISEHTLMVGREALAVLNVTGFPLTSHWYLVQRADRRLSYAAAQLVEFIDRHLDQCIEPAWIMDRQA